MNLHAGVEGEPARPAPLELPPDASLAMVADQLAAQTQTASVAFTGDTNSDTTQDACYHGRSNACFKER
jgi:hypothetical protein